MGNYAVTKIGGFGRQGNYREFLIDSKGDISALPGLDAVAIGSKAFCSESSTYYVLTNAGEWVEIASQKSGGGSSGGDSSDNGGAYVVEMAVSGDNVISCSATLQDFINADNANKIIVAKVTYEGSQNANYWYGMARFVNEGDGLPMYSLYNQTQQYTFISVYANPDDPTKTDFVFGHVA